MITGGIGIWLKLAWPFGYFLGFALDQWNFVALVLLIYTAVDIHNRSYIHPTNLAAIGDICDFNIGTAALILKAQALF